MRRCSMTSASCINKLESYGVKTDQLSNLISHAFAEDMPEGDDKTTLATIDANQTSRAYMRARKDGVVAEIVSRHWSLNVSELRR